jgi:hypothetical protein
MRMYPGPSCPDRPCSTELGDTKINTRIRGILAHRADMNFSFGSVPLREGVECLWVSSLKLILVYLCQFLLLKAHMFFLCTGSRVCT